MDDPRFVRLAALLLGIGALGVVATSAFYVLAGPQAAMPGGAAGIEAALAATPAAAPWMRLAGLAGTPSDVLLALGAFMFAATLRGPGAALAVAGWLALAIGGVLFALVDTIVGHVLPVVATLPQADAAYGAMRALFDALFALGGWTVGAGALAAAWPAHRPELRRRAVRWSMRAAGVVGLAANSAYLLGVPGAALLIGPAVVLAVLALLALAAAVWADARPAPPAAAIRTAVG